MSQEEYKERPSFLTKSEVHGRRKPKAVTHKRPSHKYDEQQEAQASKGPHRGHSRHQASLDEIDLYDDELDYLGYEIDLKRLLK